MKTLKLVLSTATMIMAISAGAQENPMSVTTAELTRAQNASVWKDVKNSESFTLAALNAIRIRFTDLSLAQDVETFCPGYMKASKAQQEICWLRLVGAMAKFESAFHPGDSFLDLDGKNSVGLLAVGTKDCPNAPTISKLKDPAANLLCGVNVMADYILNEGFIDGPQDSEGTPSGASRYWSILRTPFQVDRYNLGKKDRIVKITQTYLNY